MKTLWLGFLATFSCHTAWAAPCQMVQNDCPSPIPTQPFLETCHQAYDKLHAWLNPSFQGTVKVQFLNSMQTVAETLGNEISVSCEHIQKNPDDVGVMVHELAHVLQSYPAGTNWWMTEGIADYIREKYTGVPVRCAQEETYESGYRCAAVFLKFIESRYDPKFVSRLNETLQQKRNPDPLFEKWTGKKLQVLWRECRFSDCF